MIRYVNENDASDICEIYNYYVENTVISFEEKRISVDEMEDRINDLLTSGFPWLVYEIEVKGAKQVIGYAYAAYWKTRASYRFTYESTAYIAPDLGKSGIGTRLYDALFKELDTRIVRSIMAVIALPNDASVGFHEKMGYEKVAHFKEVGYKKDKWIDVGYWQKFL